MNSTSYMLPIKLVIRCTCTEVQNIYISIEDYVAFNQCVSSKVKHSVFGLCFKRSQIAQEG